MKRFIYQLTCMLCFISMIVQVGPGLSGSAARAAGQQSQGTDSPSVPQDAFCIFGSLSETDLKFHRPNTTTTGSGVPSPCSLSTTGTSVFFDVYEFNLKACSSNPTPVTITLCDGSGCPPTAPGFDSVLYVYRRNGLTGADASPRSFNRVLPCNNLVAANDDLSGEAVGINGSSGGLTTCTTNGQLSGVQRNLAPGNFVVVVAGKTNSTTGDYTLFIDVPNCTLTQVVTSVGPAPFDFDNDARTDLSTFTPSSGQWHILNSFNGTTEMPFFGSSIDTLVPGDYDGDGKADIAVWRSAVGLWFIRNSSNQQVRQVFWGIDGDIPVPADYDGDGKYDLATWRPSNGTWYIINSSDGSKISVGWGMSGDKPVQGDFDGDGRADFAVFRPSTGTWFILNSFDNTVTTVNWGMNGDLVVAADYDGDTRADIAVYRPSNGTWYIINSSNGSMTAVTWGAPTDIPVPGDYDGDGKADIAVYRPEVSTWLIINSAGGQVRQQVWGTPGDVPVPASYVR